MYNTKRATMLVDSGVSKKIIDDAFIPRMKNEMLQFRGLATQNE